MVGEVKEGLGTQPPGGEGVAPSPDYQAELTQAQARLASLEQEKALLEQNLRSAQGSLNKQLDTLAELSRLRRDQAHQRELLNLLASAQVREGSEELAQGVAQAQTRYQQAEVEDKLGQEMAEIYEDVLAEAQDSGLDPNVAPEYAQIRDLWNRGRERGAKGLDLMRQSLREARTIRRTRQRATLEQVRRDAEEAAQEKLRKSGVFDTPGGAAQANPQVARTFAEAQDRYIRGEISAEDYEKAKSKAR